MEITVNSWPRAFSAEFTPGAKYKYMMRRPYSIVTDIRPGNDLVSDFVTLSASGILTMLDGYAWDGASGPAIDTTTFLRGSGVHDAFYQLIRIKMLGMQHRAAADLLLHNICLEDDMTPIRAAWVYAAVRVAGRLYMKGQA